MKQFLNTNTTKLEKQDKFLHGIVVLDYSFGGAVLLHKLRLLPHPVVYLNVVGANADEGCNYAVDALGRLDKSLSWTVVLPTANPTAVATLKSVFGSFKFLQCQPPLAQATQYSVNGVCVLSRGQKFDGYVNVFAPQLAKLVETNAPQRQIYQEVERTFLDVSNFDCIAFADCVFSPIKDVFSLALPNVKVFDCADFLSSHFYRKGKKAGKNVNTNREEIHFFADDEKNRLNFSKILQKVYKSY